MEPSLKRDSSPYSAPLTDSNVVPITDVELESVPTKRRDIWVGTSTTLAFGFLAALVLDTGQTLRIWQLAALAQIAAVVMILLNRRPFGRLDRMIVRWGIFLTFAIVCVVASLLNRY